MTQDAYSDEVVSFGWWAGDHKFEEAAFYAYVHPHPSGLEALELTAVNGFWQQKGTGYLALLRNTELTSKSLE